MESLVSIFSTRPSVFSLVIHVILCKGPPFLSCDSCDFMQRALRFLSLVIHVILLCKKRKKTPSMRAQHSIPRPNLPQRRRILDTCSSATLCTIPDREPKTWLFANICL